MIVQSARVAYSGAMTHRVRAFPVRGLFSELLARVEAGENLVVVAQRAPVVRSSLSPEEKPVPGTSALRLRRLTLTGLKRLI